MPLETARRYDAILDESLEIWTKTDENILFRFFQRMQKVWIFLISRALRLLKLRVGNKELDKE